MTSTLTDIKQGLFATVQLPEQDTLAAAPGRHIPAAEMTVFLHREQDHPALSNALYLLETLYDHGVASPEVLRLILTATGHPSKTKAQAEFRQAVAAVQAELTRTSIGERATF